MERCIEILVPKIDDLFDDNDSKKPKEMFVPKKVNKFKTVIQQNYDEAESDIDSDGSDDFVEVKPVGDDDDVEEDPDIELRYLGFLNDNSSEYTRNYNLQVDIKLKENEENKIVIEIMRDLVKELKNSHLVKINIWLKVINMNWITSFILIN